MFNAGGCRRLATCPTPERGGEGDTAFGQHPTAAIRNEDIFLERQFPNYLGYDLSLEKASFFIVMNEGSTKPG